MALRSSVKKQRNLGEPDSAVSPDEQGPRRRRKKWTALAQGSVSLLREGGQANVRAAQLQRGLAVLDGRRQARVSTSDKALTRMAVGKAKRMEWLTAELSIKSQLNHTQAEFDHWMASARNGADACHAKLLQAGKQLQGLGQHIRAMTDQLTAHQEVILTATQDVENTDLAIEDAEAVKAHSLQSCGEKREEQAKLAVQLAGELKELLQIANPDVRADMAGGGAHASEHDVAAEGVGDDEAGGEAGNLTLIEKSSSTREIIMRGGGKNSAWSLRQCVAFVRLRATKERDRRQPENQTAAAEVPETGDKLPATETCELQLASLQAKFGEAVTEIHDMMHAALREKDARGCDETAETMFHAETVALVTQREKATDKVEISGGAVNALTPVLHVLEMNVKELAQWMLALKKECTVSQVLDSHLAAVQSLILSTAMCPGIEHVALEVPPDHCRTNGRTCTWTCSEDGYVFNSGFFYGHLSSVWNVPKENTHEGRAYCEKKCIQDIHCVAFVHDFRFASCDLMFDVVDGSFRKAPEYPRKDRWSCFLQERVDQVNRHRDVEHPKMDHEDINDYWWYYENNAKYWEQQFDPNGYDAYYDPPEGHTVDEDAGDPGDPTMYGGPRSDVADDWQPNFTVLQNPPLLNSSTLGGFSYGYLGSGFKVGQGPVLPPSR